jgi:hypothetical protein
VLRLPLQGFDSEGNPVWPRDGVIQASAPTDPLAPWHRGGTFTGVLSPRFAVTASDKVIFLNPGVDAGSGFHLGAVNRGSSRWLWQASPSAAMDGRGSFQTRKTDGHIEYGGNVAVVSGRSIVYGFHGEFFSDPANGRIGQANQFVHFRDDGLFIGQFGIPSTRATAPSQPGLSGNAFSLTLVRSGRSTWLFHNDESAHGGVHRWRLEGLDDIQDLSASGPLNSAVVLHRELPPVAAPTRSGPH